MYLKYMIIVPGTMPVQLPGTMPSTMPGTMHLKRTNNPLTALVRRTRQNPIVNKENITKIDSVGRSLARSAAKFGRLVDFNYF